jgi:tetratricopeptide (TPR) repeat protein
LRHRNVPIFSVAVIIVLALTVVARNQVGYWKNELTLWSHAVEEGENSNAVAHTELGSALLDLGNFDSAIQQYREALRINPMAEEAFDGLGSVYFKQGKYAQALTQYSEAMRINPGNALMSLGRDGEALRQFMEVLQINPNLGQVHSNVGVLLMNQGKTKEAIMHFKEALRLKPDRPDIQENLRSALAVQEGGRHNGQ